MDGVSDLDVPAFQDIRLYVGKYGMPDARDYGSLGDCELWLNWLETRDPELWNAQLPNLPELARMRPWRLLWHILRSLHERNVLNAGIPLSEVETTPFY